MGLQGATLYLSYPFFLKLSTIVLKGAERGRNFGIVLRLEAQIVNLLRDDRHIIKLIVKAIEIVCGKYLVIVSYNLL